jgi:N-acetylglucosaminyldiphosphoundecaprenol N-acetyl-beta-D-mannosaminyltransferase
MTKILFQNKNVLEIIKFINNNKHRKTLTFFNQHDLYQYFQENKFRKTVDKEYNMNFIDGSTIQRYLTIRRFRNVKRMRGPFFTKQFLHDKKASQKFRHFFIGFEKSDIKLLQKKLPHLTKIKGYNPPYVKGITFSQEEVKNIANKINSFKADIVWIGIGCPKQNILSEALFPFTKNTYFMNVGAALDFVLHKKSEAPKLIQAIGIEWIYRLTRDFKHTRKKALRSLLSVRYLPYIDLA